MTIRQMAYDPDNLTWNHVHTVNAQHQYCYCGEDRSLAEVCLQCNQCFNWFHERCIRVPLGPVVPFITNYLFVCRRCVSFNRPMAPPSPATSQHPIDVETASDSPHASNTDPPVANAQEIGPSSLAGTAQPSTPNALPNTKSSSSAEPFVPQPSPNAPLAPQPILAMDVDSVFSDLSDLSSPELDPSLIDDSDEDEPQLPNDKAISPLPENTTKQTPVSPVQQDDTASLSPFTPPAPVETKPLPHPQPSTDVPHLLPSTTSVASRNDPVTNQGDYMDVDEEYERVSAGWKDICATTIANLTLQVLQEQRAPETLYSAHATDFPPPECYFNKQDIVPFVDQHWKALCTLRARTTTWWATLGSCLYTVNNVFITRDGGRRTAASDFRLMDVDLWNFRPGFIPPRPNKVYPGSSSATNLSALHHRSPSKSKAKRLANPTSDTLKPNGIRPGDDIAAQGRMSNDAKKRPYESDGPLAQLERVHSDTASGGSIAGPSSALGLTLPMTYVKRTASGRRGQPKTEPGMPFSSPPSNHNASVHAIPAKRVPRTDRGLFAGTNGRVMPRGVTYTDTPAEAINQPSLVYTLYRPSPTSRASQALNFQDRHPNIWLSDNGCTACTAQGFRTVRGVHPITAGQWYIEFWVEASDHGPRAPHVRIGLALPQANLDGPVGHDKYGYGLRDETGEVVHSGRRHTFSESFHTGDVIGLYITIPALPEFEEFERQASAKLPETMLQVPTKPSARGGGSFPTPSLVTVGSETYLRTTDVPLSRVQSLTSPQRSYLGTAWLSAHLNFKPPMPCCTLAETPKRTGTGRSKHGHRAASSGGSATSSGGRGKSGLLGSGHNNAIPGSKVLVYKNGQCLGVAFEQLHSWLPLTYPDKTTPPSTPGLAMGKRGDLAHHRTPKGGTKQSPLSTHSHSKPDPHSHRGVNGHISPVSVQPTDMSSPRDRQQPGALDSATELDSLLGGAWDVTRPGYYPAVSVFHGGRVTVNSGPRFRFPPPRDPEAAWEFQTRSSLSNAIFMSNLMPSQGQKTWKPYADLWVDRPVDQVLHQLVESVCHDLVPKEETSAKP
ncbi:transcription factor, contains a PHD finger motif [Dimargaris verticillata]|uniref:Transcription factor, contains a PHD finger motif n=1 Tax=Dimargaris verticillata TaxID=2761393 RepID=A0A9W8AY96_9FUNG|nr:transcription factor, contains a PHD finger motif [Dimargaris verticillata]